PFRLRRIALVVLPFALLLVACRFAGAAAQAVATASAVLPTRVLATPAAALTTSNPSPTAPRPTPASATPGIAQPSPTAPRTTAFTPTPISIAHPTRTPEPGWIPDRLVIPAIGLEAPVEPAPLTLVEVDGRRVGQYQIPAYFAAGWHDGSAPLGVPGNTVLGGHHNIYGEVFRHLEHLNVGDEIRVYAGEREFAYRVEEKMILPEKGQPLMVRLTNAKWIEATDDERLTLVTCWPYTNNTHRLIIVARPVSG
ncbi:MAG: sortase, partial [Armatimonadetes bacterium]|nr:sortase [Armatimonadota bacterium]